MEIIVLFIDYCANEVSYYTRARVRLIKHTEFIFWTRRLQNKYYIVYVNNFFILSRIIIAARKKIRNKNCSQKLLREFLFTACFCHIFAGKNTTVCSMWPISF